MGSAVILQTNVTLSKPLIQKVKVNMSKGYKRTPSMEWKFQLRRN